MVLGMSTMQHQDHPSFAIGRSGVVRVGSFAIGKNVTFYLPKRKRNVSVFVYKGRTYNRIGKSRTFVDGSGNIAWLGAKDRYRGQYHEYGEVGTQNPGVLNLVKKFYQDFGAAVSPLEVARCLTWQLDRWGNAYDPEDDTAGERLAEEAVYQYFKAWLSRNPLIPTLAPLLEADLVTELEQQQPEPQTPNDTKPLPPPITIRPTIQPCAPNA